MTDNFAHAMSRYTMVTERLIEKCQQDYLAGRNLAHTAPSLDRDKAAIIVAESLEADALIAKTPEDWAAHVRRADVSDWSLAVLSEIFTALAEEVDPRQDIFAETRQTEYRELAWTALEKVIDSPTASPMLWYEDIFFMIGQEYRIEEDRRAIDMMKRGLAHNLRFNDGNNGENFLRDLAETYLWLDELDKGLRLLAGVIRYEPGDIWTYNAIAITFDRFGLADLGAEAIRRGLALLKAHGDPEQLESQLIDSLQDMQDNEKRGRESEVSPEVLADFRQALTVDFMDQSDQTIAQASHTLVPDLDKVPLKTPKPRPKLPPSPASTASKFVGPDNRPKPGRNDPCWCGSGKKYKKCHLRADRAR